MPKLGQLNFVSKGLFMQKNKLTAPDWRANIYAYMYDTYLAGPVASRLR